MYHVITQGAARTLAVKTDEERFAIIEEPRMLPKWQRKTIIFNPVGLAELVTTAMNWLNHISYEQRKVGRLT